MQGSVAQWAGRAWRRPPVRIIRYSHFPLFCSIVSKCEKLLSSPPHTKLFIGLYWGMILTALTETAGLRRSFAWWRLAAWFCPQVDLWAVKDGQINTRSISDRIRESETCLHLHTARIQCTSLCLPSPSGWAVGRPSRRRHHTPLSEAGNTKGRLEIPDDVIWHLTSFNGSISQSKGLSWRGKCIPFQG